MDSHNYSDKNCFVCEAAITQEEQRIRDFNIVRVGKNYVYFCKDCKNEIIEYMEDEIDRKIDKILSLEAKIARKNELLNKLRQYLKGE